MCAESSAEPASTARRAAPPVLYATKEEAERVLATYLALNDPDHEWRFAKENVPDG